MRTVPLALAAAALCLCACNRPKDAAAAADAYDQGPATHGRYTGIGIYRPDQTWSQIAAGVEAAKTPQAAGSDAPKAGGAATLKDDDEVIVVVDTKTGELRQCGNLSGFCVAMNPWAKPLAGLQSAPLPLARHAGDLEAEAAAKAKADSEATTRALARATAAAKARADKKTEVDGPAPSGD